jgi:type I restriction enzyme S subunit
MEVRPGYKQTEIGVIPADWNIKLGEQITTLIGKGASPRWQGFEYTNHGMLFVTSENVRDGFLDVSEPKYLPLAFHEKLKRTKLQPGDILVNLVGASIGRSCQIKADLGDANVNQAVGVFRVKDEYCSEYVACCFQAPTTIERILDMQVDAARPNVSLGDLRRFLIPFPSLPEQRAIATALSDVDALLGALDQLIAKNRDLKQAAMQQLLTGQTRLPGFHGQWEVKTFGELFNFSGGCSASRDQLASKGHCYLHYGDIHTSSRTFVDVAAEYHDIPKLDIPLNRVSPRSLLNDGDVVFVDASEDDTGTSKHVVVVNKEKKPFISGLHTIVAKSKTDELAHEYRRFCFQTKAIRDQFLFYAVGTKVSGISKGNIPKLTLPIPSIPEQTAIAEVLSDMDAEIAALEQRRQKTRALKQGMMQELLTGRVRLTNGEGRIENGE